MNLTTFISACLLLSLNFYGQTITNSDFENWISLPNTFGGMDPQNWTSTNAATAGANTKGITRSTDKYSGTYALALSELITPSANDTLTSAIVLGQAPLDFSNYKLDYEKGGQVFTKMIASVNGYYKFSKGTSSFDSAYALVMLKDAATAGYLGIGKYGFSPSASYIPFQINITQLITPGGPPDSLLIAFFYKSNNSSPLPQGKLLIDSLYYKNIVNTTGIYEEHNFGFTLFPNPFSETIYLNFGITGDYKIDVLSIEGRLIQEHALKNANNCELKIEETEKGIYFIRCISSETGRQYTRLMKKN